MADVNYVNPSSLDPGVGFKPEGFLGGMEWQKRNQMFEDAQNLQQLMSTIGAHKQIGEFGEWQKAAPAREAKNLADIATHTATASTIGRQKEAETVTAESDASYKKDTLASRIATTLAENATKQGQAGLDQLRIGRQKLTELAIVAQSTGGMGPANSAQRGQMLKQAGIDPASQLGQHFLGSPDFMKAIKEMTENFVAADEKAQATLSAHRMDNASREKVAEINKQATLAAAGMRLQAANRGIDDVLSGKTKLDPTQLVAVYQGYASLGPEADQVKLARLKAMAIAAAQAVQAQDTNKANRNPVLPGMPTPAPAQNIMGGGGGNGLSNGTIPQGWSIRTLP